MFVDLQVVPPNDLTELCVGTRSRVFTRLEYGEFRWLSALLLSEWNNPSL